MKKALSIITTIVVVFAFLGCESKRHGLENLGYTHPRIDLNAQYLACITRPCIGSTGQACVEPNTGKILVCKNDRWTEWSCSREICDKNKEGFTCKEPSAEYICYDGAWI